MTFFKSCSNAGYKNLTYRPTPDWFILKPCEPLNPPKNTFFALSGMLIVPTWYAIVKTKLNYRIIPFKSGDIESPGLYLGQAS